MAKNGMTSLQAIRAATLGGAELMDWSDRVGAIAPGKYADIIAFRGNPLDDVTELQRVEWVMKGGKVEKDAVLYRSGPRVLEDSAEGTRRPRGGACDARLRREELVRREEGRRATRTAWTAAGSGWDQFFRTGEHVLGLDAGARLGHRERRGDERLLPPHRALALALPRDVVARLIEPRRGIPVYEPQGAVVPGDRFGEFKEWAKRNKPEELAYLMPSADRPDRRPPAALPGLLEEWRRAAKLPAVELKSGGEK